MKQVHKKEDVPIGRHYSVIIYKTNLVYHEGDERSRTHPGHGYSAYTETIQCIEHWISTDRNDWERFVTSLVLVQATNFVAFEVTGLASTEVKIQIKT
jgi:hypothetical protein